MQTADPGLDFLKLLRRVLYRVNDLSRDLMQPLDLTPQQAVALTILRERAGLTQASLVGAMDSDPNTVSGLVRRLEQRGLLTRERRVRDARAVTLNLTAAGEAVAGHAQVCLDRLAAALTDAIPQQGGAAVTDWLKAVVAIADV